MNRTVFFVPLSLVGLFFTVYILLASTTNFLSVEPGYAIGEVSRWCERISGGYFREPANACLLYTSPSPRDKRQSRMPSSA